MSTLERTVGADADRGGLTGARAQPELVARGPEVEVPDGVIEVPDRRRRWSPLIGRVDVGVAHGPACVVADAVQADLEDGVEAFRSVGRDGYRLEELDRRALPEGGCLGCLAVTDVAGHGNDGRDAPGAVEHRGGRDGHVDQGPVPALAGRLQGREGPSCCHLGAQAGELDHLVGLDDREEPADRLLGRPAERPDRGRVPRLHHAVQVDGVDRFGYVVDDKSYPPLGCSQQLDLASAGLVAEHADDDGNKKKRRVPHQHGRDVMREIRPASIYHCAVADHSHGPEHRGAATPKYQPRLGDDQEQHGHEIVVEIELEKPRQCKGTDQIDDEGHYRRSPRDPYLSPYLGRPGQG